MLKTECPIFWWHRPSILGRKDLVVLLTTTAYASVYYCGKNKPGIITSLGPGHQTS